MKKQGQAKSRLMRSLVRFLDDALPYLDDSSCPVHEDPYHPITAAGKRVLATTPEEAVRIAWWPRKERYAERLQLLGELRRSMEKTILMVTHDPRAAQRAGRVLHLDKGRLVHTTRPVLELPAIIPAAESG